VPPFSISPYPCVRIQMLTALFIADSPKVCRNSSGMKFLHPPLIRLRLISSLVRRESKTPPELLTFHIQATKCACPEVPNRHRILAVTLARSSSGKWEIPALASHKRKQAWKVSLIGCEALRKAMLRRFCPTGTSSRHTKPAHELPRRLSAPRDSGVRRRQANPRRGLDSALMLKEGGLPQSHGQPQHG
jgi:hypothetical protein